jgi:hypothetical protein
LIVVAILNRALRYYLLHRRLMSDRKQWPTMQHDLIQVSPHGPPFADGSDLVKRTQQSLAARLSAMIANLGYEHFTAPPFPPSVVLSATPSINSDIPFTELFLRGVYRNIPFAYGHDAEIKQFFHVLRQELGQVATCNHAAQDDWGQLKLSDGRLIIDRPAYPSHPDDEPYHHSWEEAAMEAPRGVYRPRKCPPESHPPTDATRES